MKGNGFFCKPNVTLEIENYSGALAREARQQSTMGKKIK